MSYEQELFFDRDHLIDRCAASARSYRRAAEVIQNSELQLLFTNYAIQRDEMIRALGGRGARFEEPPEAPMPEDETTALVECAREEWTTLRSYQRALETDIPAALHPIVERHCIEIGAACDRLRELCSVPQSLL